MSDDDGQLTLDLPLEVREVRYLLPRCRAGYHSDYGETPIHRRTREHPDGVVVMEDYGCPGRYRRSETRLEVCVCECH